MTKKILLGANYSIIEPLGLLHLSTVARQEGYDPKIMLVNDGNFGEIEAEVRKSSPDYVGFQSFTGNHLKAFNFLDRIKDNRVKTILGGPHATYFPTESVRHADYVVVSEGFDSLRRILRGEADKGIVHLMKTEPFPASDRENFYKDHPVHRDNPIKSIITKTGCPYSCTYCYNSSGLKNLEGQLGPDQYGEMKRALGKSGRLFVDSQRSVIGVLDELEMIKKVAPKTKMIYFQDDVFGSNIDWLREFSKKYDQSFKYHAQLRFEFANPNKASGRERLELLKASGCTGLTFAIESADPIVRKEVLRRNTGESLIFDTLTYASGCGFKVRTEQMLGLPLGATMDKTPINLDADLKTLELNVKLNEKTGLPNLAWASIFSPYSGTELARYCATHGFSDLDMDEIPATFFEKSILRFPKEWVGPDLSAENVPQWMDPEELKKYHQNLIDLRNTFSTFAGIPSGHELARDFIDQEDRSIGGLDAVLKKHKFDRIIYGVK